MIGLQCSDSGVIQVRVIVKRLLLVTNNVSKSHFNQLIV